MNAAVMAQLKANLKLLRLAAIGAQLESQLRQAKEGSQDYAEYGCIGFRTHRQRWRAVRRPCCGPATLLPRNWRLVDITTRKSRRLAAR